MAKESIKGGYIPPEEKQKNIVQRIIENNKTLKYAGLTTAGVALLEVLVKGDSLSPDNQVRVAAVAVLSVVVGALGSILDMPEKS